MLCYVKWWEDGKDNYLFTLVVMLSHAVRQGRVEEVRDVGKKRRVGGRKKRRKGEKTQGVWVRC